MHLGKYGQLFRQRPWWVRLATFALICAALWYFLPPVKALFASTNKFIAHPADARVRYEPGAEKLAETAVKSLPSAIAAVEETQGEFSEPVTLYVCATRESFSNHSGTSLKAYAGGVVFNGRLFISPKPENTAERLPRIVRHELSHLQLSQALGRWRFAYGLPAWFKEGLAVYVSQGGGAENVSEAEAWHAIKAGRTIQPRGRDNLYRAMFPNLDGLPAHLFYRESGIFVGYLATRYPAEFARMLAALKSGASFDAAMRREYAKTLPALWAEFVQTGTVPGS